MFAVKGWSVDASSLKAQNEVFTPRKTRDGEEMKGGKKRKRKRADEAKQDPNVRPDDVGRLWEQHVEGKDLSKTQKQREKKRQKLGQMKEDKTGPYERSNMMPVPEGKRKIERWEDIVLGTRAEKEGRRKKSKKDSRREERDARDKEGSMGNAETAPKPKKQKEKKTVGGSNGERDTITTDVVPVAEPAKLTPMQSAMRQKLVSARFRHLNQTLYTAPSTTAQELFNQDPAMFEDYHAGFRQQVSVWPGNPVDQFIIEIRRRGKAKHGKAEFTRRQGNATSRRLSANAPLPHAALPRTDGLGVIADLGCGDARLARTLTDSGETKSLRLRILSYDLHSPCSLVTKADIASLPLADKSVDVAIFCLALMGTNWISFVEEAHRILRWKGELWVAEIKSRFGRVGKGNKGPVEHSVGGKRRQAAITKAREAKQREVEEENENETLQTEVDGVVPEQPSETDVEAFVDVLKRRGFTLKLPSEKHVDLSNKMFVKMEFVKDLTPVKGKGVPEEGEGAGPNGMKDRGKGRPKTKFIPDVDEGEPSTEDEAAVLKPCLYKIR